MLDDENWRSQRWAAGDSRGGCGQVRRRRLALTAHREGNRAVTDCRCALIPINPSRANLNAQLVGSLALRGDCLIVAGDAERRCHDFRHKKTATGTFGRSLRPFNLHSNGLEPLTFGSVVPQGFLLRFGCLRKPSFLLGFCFYKPRRIRCQSGENAN